MLKCFILAAVGSTLATSAGAQTASQLKPVTRAELIKELDTRFAAADANHDGSISKAEIQAAQNAALKQVLTLRDRQVRAQFDKLDTNKDGKLSFDEFAAGAPNVKANETPDQVFAEMDSNKDGKISADEFKSPRIAQFNKIDANKDGVVTVDEIRRAAAAQKK